MRALRLETFDPVTDPQRARAEARRRETEAAREEGYRAGWLAGQEAATEAFLDDQAKLTSVLVETLQDGLITNEAARRAVVAGVGPLVTRLFEAVAPALADAGIVEEIVRQTETALRAAPAAKPRIRCAPELVGRLRDVLDAHRIDGSVEEAPELLPREAEIAWDQGYDHVDLDGCIARIRAMLAAHLNLSSETETDERRRYG
jgi:flagellar biosynthesis/type III secretory pathway protein FliH